jgi:sugar (pentulose or hexulose) kinase
MITIDDVKKVAYDLKLNVSETEAHEALLRYPYEQEQDPEATWDLVVEHCLYCVVSESV